MKETRTTAIFVALAVLLSLVAWAINQRRAASEPPQGRGEAFFPAFTDPNAASSLEVVEFDETTSLVRPFKVLNRDGRWIIPSHHDYPADASDRLPAIAAAVVALRKDDIASDNVGDQERCGVLDPLDSTLPGTAGRGTHVTVKGPNEIMLADIIIGNTVEGRPNLRYVRLPGRSRIYIAHVGDLPISTRFEDWIERNLLQVAREDIDQVVIRNYSTEAKTGKVDLRELLVLRKTGRDAWTADRIAPHEAIDTYPMNLLITKLVELAIVDVRPKPAALTASLSKPGGERLLQSDVADLVNRGFYFTSDGSVLSNQGEVVAHTTSGIFYVLRFGEVAYGVPDARYLFISVGFDPSATTGGGNIPEAVRSRLEVLRARFAPWYYLVSNDSFEKIRLRRSALITPRAAKSTTQP
jgi:hypothetical protein